MTGYSSINHGGGASYEIENQASKPSSYPTLHSGQSYEVFLSFRGEDTRYGCTDHHYRRLVDAGISVFRDSEELRIGETVAPDIFRAIKASQISIPVISPDYASSKWCLNQLVQILMCMKTAGQHVLPIFYKVEPSDIRHQKGSFGKAFKLYNKKHNFDGKLVQEWKNALAEVSSLTGWESNKVANGHEGELVKIVVTKVFNELRKAILDVPDLLVGVEDHVKMIISMIEARPSNDVNIVGISGMGGIGKTTLAKVIYNKLSDNFECSSFVPNIREASSQHRGMEGLQKHVISDILMDKSPREISNVDEGITIIKKSFKGKKVLLPLDDVENRDQLNKLAADPSWFGPQSIIIVTTRNKELIEALKSSLHYELNELDFNQSFQLFRKHAFGKEESPSVELETIANDIVHTTGGLPLAIEVIGSLLFQKNKDAWKVTLKKLKSIPNYKVQEKLRISYDALKHEEQQILLNIACLLIKERLGYAFYMWDDSGFYPEEGIRVLISLSLIKIGDKNQLIIHYQLRDLGREIVRSECYLELGNRSRLWIPEEAIELARRLKVLNLNWCYFTTTPDFSTLVELEILNLSNCWSLRKIHPSICNLNKTLKILDVRDCITLEELPLDVGKMEELRELLIDWTDITEILISEGFVTKLEKLSANYCEKLMHIPDSIGTMKMLRSLSLEHCASLTKIPEAIGKLKLLTELRLKGTGVAELPDSIGDLHSLDLLNMEYICIKRLPTTMGMLSDLQVLNLDYCRELKSLPNLPVSLTSLTFHGDSMETLPDVSYLTNLKDLKYSDAFERRNRALNLGKLNQLNNLGIFHSMAEKEHRYEGPMRCPQLVVFEDINLFLEITSSLVKLQVCECQTLRHLPNMLNLKRLSELFLEDCCGLMEIDGLEGAESLTYLLIRGCNNLSKLSGLGVSVTKLILESCPMLKSLPHLATAKNLK